MPGETIAFSLWQRPWQINEVALNVIVASAPSQPIGPKWLKWRSSGQLARDAYILAARKAATLECMEANVAWRDSILPWLITKMASDEPVTLQSSEAALQAYIVALKIKLRTRRFTITLQER